MNLFCAVVTKHLTLSNFIMNQNILIQNSEDCEAGGQMKVSGKGLLVPPFHGRKGGKSE